jgi:dCMP deaminase
MTCLDCGTFFQRGRGLSEKEVPRCNKCATKREFKLMADKKPWQKEYVRTYQRKRRLKHRYGLTLEDFDRMLDAQGGVCAICKKCDPKKTKSREFANLVVDHDHVTGETRGLLCHNCNRAIGQLEDNPYILQRAAAYLTKYRERNTWDSYFVEFARLASTRSKDPSSQVGAVLVRDKRVLATGYNGLPSQLRDYAERYDRPLKYSLVIHAEKNCIINAVNVGLSCKEATMYISPFYPCIRCAMYILQAGIKEVVIDNQVFNPRYEEEFEMSRKYLADGGVVLRQPDNQVDGSDKLSNGSK